MFLLRLITLLTLPLLLPACAFSGLIRQPAGTRPAQITKNDLHLFSWCLDGICQEKKWELPEIRTYGRDLDFVLRNCSKDPRNPKLVDQARAMGKKVICYMSFGSTDKERIGLDSYERKYDGVKKCGQMERYPKEEWIDFSSKYRADALARVKAVISMADGCCDALEYDNTDGFEFPPKGKKRGDCVNKKETAALLGEICLHARALGMGSILKNGYEIAEEVARGGCFSGAITEACDQTEAEDDMMNCGKMETLCKLQGRPCVNISYRDEGKKKHDCQIAKKYGFAESYLEGSSTAVIDAGVEHCSQQPGWESN